MNIRGDILSDKAITWILLFAGLIVIVSILISFGLFEKLSILLPQLNEEDKNESYDVGLPEGGDSIYQEGEGEAGIDCILRKAYWVIPVTTNQEEVSTEAIETQVAELIVEGEDCQGAVVSFEIWEEDSLSSNDNAKIQPKNGVFNSSGIAKTNWNVEAHFDFGGLKYFFRASLDDPNNNIVSGALEVKRI